MKISLIADQAIGEATTRNADGLGFEAYARVLASAAADTRGPFTIGVFGEWGTGKTSLMRLIERQLADEPQVVTVWFNAWRYEQEEHPIIALVGTIVQALEKHRGARERFGEAHRRLVRALRAIAYGFSAKSKIKVPGFAEVEASFVAKDMIERDDRLTPDPLLDRSLYFGAFTSLDEVKLDSDVRVVVLIDDLDRCFPDQAIRLLESIKLVLAQPGFIFVLGVARKVIEGYLQHRYASEYGIADFRGELYLDKIVQLPFHIPPSAPRMGEFSKSLLAGQPPQVVAELEPVLPFAAEALGGNPRALIRFVNNILIDYSIASALPQFTVVPVRFFAVSRCLEHRWPQVFSLLTEDPELAHEVGNGLVDALPEDRQLLRLLSSDPGVAWLIDDAQREASVSFLLEQHRFSPLDASEVAPQFDVMLSYEVADSAAVTQLGRSLSRAEISVLMGVDLASSAVMLLCIGRTTKSSASQLADRRAARKRGVRIIPVVLAGSSSDDIPEDVELLSPLSAGDVAELVAEIKTLSRRG
jgi:hypothetical protein